MATGERHLRSMTKAGRYSPGIAYPTKCTLRSGESGGRNSQKSSRLVYGTASRDPVTNLIKSATKVDQQPWEPGDEGGREVARADGASRTTRTTHLVGVAQS